jgi:hypothetical protein
MRRVSEELPCVHPETCINGTCQGSTASITNCATVNNRNIPEVAATYYAFSGRHFHTFDGTFYDFPGLCMYNLLSSLPDADAPEFKVYITNNEHGANLYNSHVSRRYLEVHVYDLVLYIEDHLVYVGRIQS